MSILSPRDVPLGGLRAMTVRRTLPNRQRTTIGAWCFIDHFGPDEVITTGGMHVAPHPHTGLQTVTWFFEGQGHHVDSVGSSQMIEPGQVNLMTAGRGISHAEDSTQQTTSLHGVQLWVALPDEYRHVEPFFEHHVCPRTTIGPAQFTVFAGTIEGDNGPVTSPTTTFSELVGAEIIIPANTTISVPVNEQFEYGLLVDSGEIVINSELAPKDHLAYVAPGASPIVITTNDQPSRLVLLGGVPFEEELVMWWNFIARSHEEIVELRNQWQSDVIEGKNPDGIFGTVSYDGPAIPAPDMPRVTLRPRKLPQQ